jgi:hypothetical protein
MGSYERLLARVRQVRTRWRSQVLVRGVAIFLAASIAILVLGVWGADLFGFKPAAVWFLRFLTGGAVLFVAWYFLYLPLHARVSDVTIAQYIEEQYPQLEDRLVTAIEYGRQKSSASSMIDLLIQDALNQASRVDFSVFLNRQRLAAFGTLGFGSSLIFFALLTWGPSFFPYGFSHLYAPWTQASLGSAMMITVLPGNVEIAKGSDQLIDAHLVGFDSPNARLHRQGAESGQWNSTVMEQDPRGGSFRYLLVDIRNSQRYYVESKGIRSPVYSLQVVDRAAVEKIDLTYNFPAYTGMSPQVVENDGDISALKGTRMDIRIHLSIPVKSARLLFDDQSTLNLSATAGRDFGGSFVLQHSGSYAVQVTESRGGDHPASPEYDIEAVEDGAPKVTITRPMRDLRATSVEEVSAEVNAEDDIGVGRFELHYSVNGLPEKIVSLYRGNSQKRSINAAHTFFLEDFGLQPGDLISYYAKAWDGNNVTGPAASSSDIYFIQIRPFEQNYKQSQQQAMPGSQGNESQEALSRQQKEIISATFKLVREKDRMESKEYQDSLKSLALVQSRLQAQAQGLVDRLERREAAQAGPEFEKLGEYLKNAVSEMGKAAADLGAQKPSDALPTEQKSLQQVMRAESLFRDIQVSFSAQNAGSSGSQANAEDLADLFELELNKLKNQYETVQRAERQERDQKTDEALERLKELAQRQQQINESNRLRAQQGASPSSAQAGGAQSQQQIMEQAEQLRRQLQRLSRERSSPQLDEASNRMEKAIEEMKKALQDSQTRNGSEQSAQGQRVLQQLNEAARRLARTKEAGIKEGVDQVAKESGDLVKQQEKIQQELGRLAQEMPRPESQEEAIQRSKNLVSTKNALKDRLDSLENRIRDLARQARETQKSTSSRLADAANTIQDRRLSDRIQEGNRLVQNGFYESQQRREDFIQEGLEEVQRQLEAAKSSLGESEEGRIEEAANRARQLSEGLESMQRRMSTTQRGRGNNSGSQQQAQRGSQQQEGQQGGQQAQRGSQQQEGRQGSQQGQRGSQQQEGRQGGQQSSSEQQAQNSRGMPAEQGRDAQNPQGANTNPDVDVRELSDNALGPPTGIGQYRDNQATQLNRELAQRLTDARNLRGLINRNPTQMQNLDRVIDELRKSRNFPDYGSAEQIALLKAAIDHLRQVEIDLGKDLARLRQIEEYFTAGNGEAPEAYRRLVEEYYKSIAETK